MKVAVCLKRVPDTTAKIVVAADGKSIDETGIKFVPNPYDEYALEEALKLKEAAGSGETVAISVGTDASQETLRTALAMGFDRAVLLQSPGSRRWTRGGPGPRRRTEGRRVRSRPVRQDGRGRLQPSGRA